MPEGHTITSNALLHPYLLNRYTVSLWYGSPAFVTGWGHSGSTAYTTALLPRLASGKASTLLASLALACAKAGLYIKSFSLGPKASVKAKDLIQLKSRISAALNMRLRLGDHIVP